MNSAPEKARGCKMHPRRSPFLTTLLATVLIHCSFQPIVAHHLSRVSQMGMSPARDSQRRSSTLAQIRVAFTANVFALPRRRRSQETAGCGLLSRFCGLCVIRANCLTGDLYTPSTLFPGSAEDASSAQLRNREWKLLRFLSVFPW